MIPGRVATVLPALLLLLGPQALAQEQGGAPCVSAYQEFANQSSAPNSLWRLVNESAIRSEFEPDVCTLNPWYLMGDFDADGAYDYAVLFRRNDERSKVRAAVLLASGVVHWLDRDERLKYPGPQAWTLHPSYVAVGRGVGEGDPPVLKGDGIRTYKLEASSALIYWNGERFVSYWQGD